MKKRKLDLLVISDVHLGIYGCHAQELVNYLKTVKPKVLVLNGDIVDIWQFKKSYFPKAHQRVISQIMKMSAKGTKVHYLIGNHDEVLRKFIPFQMGNIELENKLLLELDGKKAWFFHGDVFDTSIKFSKTLAKLGGFGYDLLVTINLMVNKVLKMMGKPKMSLSKKVKDSVKGAVKYIQDFENIAAELAIEQGYDYVILGHIHQPQKRRITNDLGSTLYLNSGDWIENLTALEYVDQEWTVYQYNEDDFKDKNRKDSKEEEDDIPDKVSYEQLVNEVVNAKLSHF